MQQDVQMGWRIRQLRRTRHLTQTQLAEAVGISSSYLNLIEHNRRKVTVPLLFSLAGYFGVEIGDLAEGNDASLLGDLMEALGDNVFVGSEITNLEARDLAVTNPGAAKAMLHLYNRYRELAAAAPARPPTEELSVHSATELISDFIQSSSNYFDALETAAERVRRDIDNAGSNFDSGLEAYLGNVYGIQVELGSLPQNTALVRKGERGKLIVSEILPAETARFLIARELGTMTAAVEIDRIIDASDLPEGEAHLLARNTLAAYFAAALIMPYERFLTACRDTRYDLERLARRFGVSFEQVCHRATTLQRPGQSGIPLHLVRTDVAGNISKRFSLSGIHIPRHSGACPRWNIYSAFHNPEEINVQISQSTDGQRYFCIARTVSKGSRRHGAIKRYLSIGLGCSIVHARQMVYSDGIDLENEAQVVAVGTNCRICPRLECEHRAYPPAEHRFGFNEETRPVSIYARITPGR